MQHRNFPEVKAITRGKGRKREEREAERRMHRNPIQRSILDTNKILYVTKYGHVQNVTDVCGKYAYVSLASI